MHAAQGRAQLRKAQPQALAGAWISSSSALSNFCGHPIYGAYIGEKSEYERHIRHLIVKNFFVLKAIFLAIFNYGIAQHHNVNGQEREAPAPSNSFFTCY